MSSVALVPVSMSAMRGISTKGIGTAIWGRENDMHLGVRINL